MVFQKTWAGSDNVDVVYGPKDNINPVINHLGEKRTVKLVVTLKELSRHVLEKKVFENIDLQEGHTFKYLEGFKFNNVKNGTYAIEYDIFKN